MQPNLSLYTAQGLLILDSEGHRILAKYWTPAHHPQPEMILQGLSTTKEQRVFEKGLWEKTRKAASGVLTLVYHAKRILTCYIGEVIIFDGHLVLYRQTLDLLFYIISSPNENELMLQSGFTAFYDALSLLFKNQLEKRVLLDNLDVLLLALDETFDDG